MVGSREYIVSWFSQEEIAEQWEKEIERRAPETDLEYPRQPRKPPAFERGDFIARMTIPRLGADLYIVEGVGKKELRKAPGHMIGSGFPGQPDNSIIAGHRDTHFRVLKDIREGDDIVLQFDGDYFVYRVRETRIVRPSNREVLQPARDSKLTLITCYPFYYVGSAPNRFIVEAELTNRVSLNARPVSPGASVARFSP
jgi:sortase A